MKKWLALAGLLLFFALPAILTVMPPLPKAVPVQEPGNAADPDVPPPLNLLTADQREAVFLDMWSLVAREYLYFDRRNVDWDAVREKYLPLARNAANDWELRTPLSQALAELNDGHVYLIDDEDAVGRPHLWVEPDGDRIVIAWVDAHSDAAAAGLLPGMALLEVDGVPITEAWEQGIAVSSSSTAASARWKGARAILRGRFGTKTTLTAGFPGQAPVAATLVRNASVSPYESMVGMKELPGGIVYIHLRTFNDDSVSKAADALLQEVADANPPGLIVDVRYNRGGVSEWVAWLSGNFIRPGTTVARILDHGTQVTQHLAPGQHPKIYDGPMVVLTNPGCGSACDVFATIMKQAERAKLVGDDPGGTGIRSDERFLLHGFKIKLPTRWELLDADGKPIEGNPAQVDYRVIPTAEDWAAGRDPALEKALELLQAP